jgi:hypothetical protein
VVATRTRQSRTIHGTAAPKNCALFDVPQFYRAALVLGVGVDNLSTPAPSKRDSTARSGACTLAATAHAVAVRRRFL